MISSRLRKKAPHELVFAFWLSESWFFFLFFLCSGKLLDPASVLIGVFSHPG